MLTFSSITLTKQITLKIFINPVCYKYNCKPLKNLADMSTSLILELTK